MNWNVVGSMAVTLISVFIFSAVCIFGLSVFMMGGTGKLRHRIIGIIIIIAALVLHVILISLGINYFLLS